MPIRSYEGRHKPDSCEINRKTFQTFPVSNVSIGKMPESLDQKVWPKSCLDESKMRFPPKNLADILFWGG